jgi:hypothetical protein
VALSEDMLIPAEEAARRRAAGQRLPRDGAAQRRGALTVQALLDQARADRAAIARRAERETQAALIERKMPGGATGDAESLPHENNGSNVPLESLIPHCSRAERAQVYRPLPVRRRPPPPAACVAR